MFPSSLSSRKYMASLMAGSASSCLSFVWFLVGVLVVVALDIAAHFLRLRNDSIEHVNYECIHGSCNALPGSR